MADINSKYSGLLEQESGESDEEGEGRAGKGGFIDAYGWHLTLDNISNNRRELWNHFLEMGVIEFLNTLNFYRNKQAWERAQTKHGR